MAASTYGPTEENIVSSWLAGKTLKAMLVGSGYTPNYDTHGFRSDITGEITGTGYTAGGITLTGVAVSRDATTNRVKIAAANADFGAITATGITGIIVYVSTGTATTDRLLSHHSMPAQSPNNIQFIYQWAADGIGYHAY